MATTNCPTCGTTPTPKPGAGPIVIRSTSRIEGSCNFCRRWIGSNGTLDHEVTVVRSGEGGMGIIVRFCDLCMAALQLKT